MLPKKLLIVFALVFIISLSVFAEDVKVLMNDGKTYEGELLGLTDTTVFLKDSSGKVSELSVTDVKAIFNSKTHQSIPLPKTSVPKPVLPKEEPPKPVPIREDRPKIQPQPRQTTTGKPGYGVRFSLNLGLLPWYFGNKDMIDSWKAMVPSSEYDGLQLLTVTLDASLVVKVYKGFSMGFFYGMFGPEISKTLTYTTSGYWYYYYGYYYYHPPGSYDEKWSLSFSSSTHTGVIFRYYLNPYDEQKKTTFSSGAEIYLELCVGTTNLEGALFKNSTERLAYFTGTGPYYHIGAGINIKKPNQPFLLSVKFLLPLGKVTSIKTENGDVVYNADGSKFTVEYSSIQIINVGIGFGF
ncbi:hypothetical protein KAU33_12660 [Candidatus Dependentiae bacterium]|nr:hypothetical protein [Candidatus Dependentiae bacterium]